MSPNEPFAGRYERLRPLGRGGFGAVFRAWDTQMEREVAVKLLNADLAANEDWRRRFRQEATAASRLTHPNITVVFDRGESDGQPFLVMELVEGETLSHLIERQAPLRDAERVFLLEQLCDGLHYAHQRQIVHRDVKPVNLIVREDRDEWHAVRTLKILDFGIAKVVNAGLTMTGGPMLFSPSYVSPEQVRGRDVDRRSDMFAVGAVAYELLTCTKAFPILATSPIAFLDEVRRRIVDEPHPSMRRVRPEIDAELCEIVDRALAKDPGDRFRDLGEMRRRLHAVRERLEDAEPDAREQTRIVVNPAISAALAAGRAALAANDPAAVRRAVEPVLAAAPEGLVRRELEQLLDDAREADVRQSGATSTPPKTIASPPERDHTPSRSEVGIGPTFGTLDVQANPDEQRRSIPRWAFVVVAIVLALGVFGVTWQRPARTNVSGPPVTPAAPQPGNSAGTPVASTAIEDPATATVATTSIPPPVATTVTIDAHPWARVRVRPSDANAERSVQAGDTPVVFLLVPGDYVVDVLYEGRAPAVSESLSVATESITRTFTRPGYDPARAATDLLGPQK